MKRRPARPGFGMYANKLVERIESFGFANVTIHPTLGYYRTAWADCERWCAHATATESNEFDLPAGFPVSLHSYDAVVACARRGIELTRDSRDDVVGLFDAHAKAAAKRSVCP